MSIITVRPVHSVSEKRCVFVADGPDGHTDLLARGSAVLARVDGERHFLATRELVNGRWVLR